MVGVVAQETEKYRSSITRALPATPSNSNHRAAEGANCEKPIWHTT